MKKTILFLAFSIGAVALLVVGTLMIFPKNEEEYTGELQLVYNGDSENPTSDIYEIVDFTPPNKTVYSMSDVYKMSYPSEDGEIFVTSETITFDGKGMKFTVKNKETGEEKVHKYTGYNLELDGVTFEHTDEFIGFKFDSPENTKLTPGEYTAEAILQTDDGKCVKYPFEFTLVED